MDSWIFQIARKICIVAFGANIFIHAVMGASAANGVLRGTLSMGAMLVLLILLSGCDLKRRVGKNRKKRKKPSKTSKERTEADERFERSISL